MFITNRQKRPWILPAGVGLSGNPETIQPGASVEVNKAEWDKIRKGNPVIDALLSTRALTAGRSGAAVDADELSNPASPTAPESLKQLPEGVEAAEGHRTNETVNVPVPPADDVGEVRPSGRNRRA